MNIDINPAGIFMLVVVILASCYGAWDTRTRRERARAEKSEAIKLAFEEWLRASTETGEFLKANPYASCEHPRLFELLCAELTAFQRYVHAKGGPGPGDEEEIRRLRTKLAGRSATGINE